MAGLRHEAPWHRESYDLFIKERLPELIASRLPLAAYEVKLTGAYSCAVHMTLTGASGAVAVEVPDIPQPDAAGLFETGGQKVVVPPMASREELADAEVQCVGEQLLDYVEPRIGEAPPHLPLDEELVRSWLPVDKWFREFLVEAGQPIRDCNWLSQCEHLRSIVTDVPLGQQRIVVKGQLGRVCPIMTPEGPNIGRVHYLARGATVRDRRIVIEQDDPVSKLSVTASTIPLLNHDDTNRTLMGANMLRQWLPLEEAEPALVQTGEEPDVPGFWCGQNLLTAFVSWGMATVEDGIVLSESCARRFCVDGVIEPGDKLANRHGTKGVVSQILPDDEMPHLQDGTPVDLVFSFLGLHTRMNLGQVREAVLGRLARAEGAPVIAGPFDGPGDEAVQSRLALAGLPENGMETLRMGKAGADLERSSAVGWVYWGVTEHLARHKIRVATGAEPGIVRSDLAYHVLREVGAYANMLESLNTTACARPGVEDLPRQLADGKVAPSLPPTPMFLSLQARLAAGGVRMGFTGESVTFALADPPGERLTLATPVRHPWLRGHDMTTVGVVREVGELAPLQAANEQAGRVFANGTPERLRERARTQLGRAVDTYFRALLRPGDQTSLHEFYLPPVVGRGPTAGSHANVKGRIEMAGQVSFTGRAMAAPGLALRSDLVGVPETIAWELFGPMVVRELGSDLPVRDRTREASKTLDKVMTESWVILNRAPTMPPTVMLAFHPVRVPEKVVRLHPLACMLMNADFDGDILGLCLPVTAEAQQEAGEKLSIAAHLTRDPRLIKLLTPPMESLWGLAHLGLSEEGRNAISEVAGGDLVDNDGIVTSDSVTAAFGGLLRERGAAEVLAILERLTDLGFDAAKRSGVSMNPFGGESLPVLERPEPLTPENWFDYTDEIGNEILSRTDYDSLDIGPQLLAVKCGARGRVEHIFQCVMGATVVDIDDRFVFIPRSFLAGLAPDEVFVRTVGALRGLGTLHVDGVRMCTERRKAFASKGYSVLARALRSRSAGAVLARAAATGEIDPLTDPDARLFAGLSPDTP